MGSVEGVEDVEDVGAADNVDMLDTSGTVGKVDGEMTGMVVTGEIRGRVVRVVTGGGGSALEDASKFGSVQTPFIVPLGAFRVSEDVLSTLAETCTYATCNVRMQSAEEMRSIMNKASLVESRRSAWLVGGTGDVDVAKDSPLAQNMKKSPQPRK